MTMLSIIITFIVTSLHIHHGANAAFIEPSVSSSRIPLRPAFSSSSAETTELVDSSSKTTLTVALTREKGKNGKLQEALVAHPSTKLLSDTLDLKLVEINCIEHATGSDIDQFTDLVSSVTAMQEFDYIVITSPESAKVFTEAIRCHHDIDMISNDLPKIAAVGKATKTALTQQGFAVDFTPTKANGETLAEELPYVEKAKLNRVLYPSSAKAANTIHDMLTKRKDASFEVTRLNTYDTVPVTFTDEENQCISDDVDIACFGSPSTVDSWLANIDRFLGISDKSEDERRKAPGSNGNVIAVCIGSTTAKKCLETGRWESSNIYYPKQNPGVEGWADSCFNAAGDVLERQFWGGGW